MKPLLAVLVFLSSLPMANATTVKLLTFDELVSKASLIVVGTVANRSSYWTADHRLILTDYTMHVSESMKGSGSPDVTVTTLGGKVGDIVLSVSGTPTFEIGESAVVFLESAGAYKTIVGLNQGKFQISGNEVHNSISGLDSKDGKPGNSVRLTLDDLRAAVRNSLKKN